MGSSSPSPVVNVNIYLSRNEKEKEFPTFVDPNNPSTIDISNLKPMNNITETPKISNNNRNNDPAPPTSISSSQKSANKQININEGETNTSDGNQQKTIKETYINTIEGNLDINSGGNNTVEKYYKTPNETTKENSRVEKSYKTPNEITKENSRVEKSYKTPNETTKENSGAEKSYKTPNVTTKGNNININFGGNNRFGENNPTPIETPYSKPTNTAKIGYVSKNDLNDSDSNLLEFSREIIYTNITLQNINENKPLINQKIKEGYFPIFFKLDEEVAKFLFIKNHEIMKNVLQNYKNLIGIDYDKEYILYNKNTKQVIPQDVPLKDLGIKYFTFISNNI